MQRVNKAMSKMDVKKGQSSSASKKVEKKKAVAFASEVKQELKRIDWTTKDELKSYTKVVVACIFLFGLLIYFLDVVIRGSLGFLNLIVKLLAG